MDGNKLNQEAEYWWQMKYGAWMIRLERMIDVLDIRYKKHIKHRTVAEVGPGPYGGIFWKYPIGKKMYCIEPIIDIYKEYNLWEADGKCILIQSKIEDINPNDIEECDTVIACNSIDHGYNIWKAIDNIYSIMKDDGICKLFVHCRNPKQTDKLHIQTLVAEDVIRYCEKIFDTHLKIYEKDPFTQEDYVSVYGDLKK